MFADCHTQYHQLLTERTCVKDLTGALPQGSTRAGSGGSPVNG